MSEREEPVKKPTPGRAATADGARKPKDASERDFIISSTDRCLCVEAGAGTGKTTLLIDRIMGLILKEKARLRDIAAITFTEKAAGELKVRLYEKLDDKLEEGAPPEEEPLLRRALEDLEACQVSTIHAFATNLLRTRPVEAGVDPLFQVADDNEMRLISADAWRKWLEEKMAERDPFLDHAEAFNVNHEKLKALAECFHGNRDLTARFHGLGRPDPRDIESALEDAGARVRKTVAALEGVLARYTPPERDTSWKAIQKLFEQWRQVEDGGGRPALVSLLTGLTEPKDTGRGNWKPAPDAYEEQLSLRRDLFRRSSQALARLGRLIVQGLTAHVLDYTRMVDEEKERRGALDFEDLLIKTRDMLRDDRGARAYFQEKYSHILVDEFQDTDPLQAEIVFFLAEDGPRAGSWQDVLLKPGKLFIVGDPKQAIYRFRRADIETYDRAKAIMGGDAATRYIWQNFRSVPGIIDWVNDALSRAMSAPLEEAYQAEYVPIEPFEPGGDAPSVRIVHNRDQAEKEDAETSREREAVFLAREITDLVSGETEVRVRGGGGRPVRYSDIAVLFRFMTNIHIYERVFRAFDIPFRTEGGRNFYTRQEVVDLLNAVCAIDNPHDQVSVVGALRSPFFSVSDAELARHALSGGRFCYLDDGRGDDRISDAFRILRDLHAGRNDRPVATTLELLLDMTAAREVYAAGGRGEQTLANFGRLLDEARALEQAEKTPLGQFASWLTEMEEANVAAGESPVEEVGGEFVHMMSIHKAKGLEFPVVFISGIGTAPRDRDVRLVTRHVNGEVEFMIGHLKTGGFEALDRWNKQSEKAEERRVLYVSTTRARDLLVINDFQAKRSTSWLKPVLDDTGAREACSPFEESVDLSRYSFEESEKKRPAKAPAAARVNLASEQKAWETCIAGAFERGRGGDVTMTATEAEGPPPYPEKEFWPGVEIGRAVGTALHRVMELMPLDPTDIEKRMLVKSIAAREGVADREPQLLQMVDNILGSDLWRRATSAGFCAREMPFCVRTGDGYMTSSVDLVFVEGGGVFVVDYKADNVAADAVAGRLDFYREQGEFYSRALSGLTQKPTAGVYFIFAAPGVVRSIDV